MRGENRWLALFVGTRLIATAAGVALLLAHTVTSNPLLFAALTAAYGVGTILAVAHWETLQRNAFAWGVDASLLLLLMVETNAWRSPFYVLGLTALIFPATCLPFRRALAYGGLYAAGYFAVAVATGIDFETLRQTSRLEGFATHLIVPMITVLALAYAATLLRDLAGERERSERLAVEAERRRIAWELHDSAKQRVHAAHLMLSQRRRRDNGSADPMLDQAIAELQAASTDIDTSLGELRTPLEADGLAESLRGRAAELERMCGVPIEVAGVTPELPTTVAAHSFRVVSEAITNAVRHSGATRVRARVEGRGRRLYAEVSDDGRGLPEEIRPGANGIRSMRARAGMLGGSLEIVSGNGAGGVTVILDVPIDGAGSTEPVSDPTAAPVP